MSRDEEIESPPYPGEGSTTDLMYDRLKELRDWVLRCRTELNEFAGTEAVPNPKKFPKKEIYATQPVLVQFQHFMMMRNIREAWDELLRDHEDSWSSKMAIRRRMMLVTTAADMLSEAFVPFEVREARAEQQMVKTQKRFKFLRRYMDQILSNVPDEEEEDT